MLSNLATDHLQRPRNTGQLESFDAYGVGGEPGGGPYVELWLQIERGTVCGVAYRTHGCASATATASILSELIKNRSCEKLLLLTPEDLVTVIGGLPPGKSYLAKLAITALRDALENYG